LRPFSPSNQFLLYRRIIEIRDWQYRLRTYVHPEMRRWATDTARRHELTQADTDTLIEAAELASALEAHERNHRYQAGHTDRDIPVKVAANQLFEARSLKRVDAVMRRSPLVVELCQRARADLPQALE
jgi:hypothetical protein